MNGLTVLDILLVALVAWGCISGFMRGFVQEVLSLGAWLVALFALRLLHEPLTLWLSELTGGETTGSLLAFILIMGAIGGGGKLVARRIGSSMRSSAIGPVDRVLGAGFGLLKAVLIAATAFMLANLGYDLAFGKTAERPKWMSESRSFAFLRATSNELSDVIAQRLKADGADATPAQDSAANK